MDEFPSCQVTVEMPSRHLTEIDADDIHRSRPRHHWLTQHLEVLCLLYRFYDNSPRAYADIFNKLFQDNLRGEGFKTGLNHQRLVSRWNSLKDWDGAHDLWRKISVGLTQREARHRYRNLLDDIEEAALELEIPLTLRVQAHHGALQHSRHLRQRARRVREIRGVLGERASPAEGTNSEDEPSAKLRRVRSAGDSPRGTGSRNIDDRFPAIRSAPVGKEIHYKVQHLSTAATPLGQVMQSRPMAEKPSSRPSTALPHMLFRFSDDNSSSKGPFFNDCMGFIAGRYVDHEVDIPPPPTGEALKAVALSHLTPELIPTPFISFFSTMLPAFNRAIRSSSNPYLTIIDGHIAEKHLKDRFGEAIQVTYSVKDIVTKFMLELRGGYDGTFPNGMPISLTDETEGPTEYLLYGVVNSNAIVGVLSIQDLLQSKYYGSDLSSVLQLGLIKQAAYSTGLSWKLVREADTLTYKTGQVVGRFLELASVKPGYWEVLARYAWNLISI
jgi:hypothetical protein